MTRFVGKRAIVTGAGSGIGAALCRALADAGADVLCTDIDGAAAEHTAASLGTRGTALQLDVTDATAVQQAVDGVVERAGRIDLLFNNAGITWGGDTELLTLDQWNSIIDVNIRGDVHGVHAAYPQMVRQRSGHIINTASMAGLVAAGRITSYVMTKHAVVGLSLALRTEALGREFYRMGQRTGTFYSPDRLAADTLRAIERNKALLVAPRQARAAWLFARLAPGLLNRMAVRFVDRQRPDGRQPTP